MKRRTIVYKHYPVETKNLLNRLSAHILQFGAVKNSPTCRSTGPKSQQKRYHKKKKIKPHDAQKEDTAPPNGHFFAVKRSPVRFSGVLRSPVTTILLVNCAGEMEMTFVDTPHDT